MPKISIIIPCYNQGEYLRDCLNSLKNQTFTDFEVIVVNDGSTDERTKDILKSGELEKIVSQVQIFHKENGGLSSARNFGILKVTGDWIVPLDSDDMLESEYLAKTLNLAEENKLDFVVTDMQNFEEKNSIYRTNINFYDELFNNKLSYCALFSAKVFTKELYDENMRVAFEDWEFWIRVLKAGFSGEVLHEPLFLYRCKAVSMLQDSHIKRFSIIQKIREKHADLYEKDFLKVLKKEWAENRQVNVFFHNLLFEFGKRCPRVVGILVKVVFRLKG